MGWFGGGGGLGPRALRSLQLGLLSKLMMNNNTDTRRGVRGREGDDGARRGARASD